jgi:hypothetical protein
MTLRRNILLSFLALTGCVSTHAQRVSPSLSFEWSSETGTSYNSATGVARRGIDFPPLVSGVTECNAWLTPEEAAKLSSLLRESTIFQEPNPPTANEKPYCDLSAPSSGVTIWWKGKRRTRHFDGCGIGDTNSDTWNAFSAIAYEKVERCR